MVDPFREDTLSAAASALARGLKGEPPLVGPASVAGDGSADADPDGPSPEAAQNALTPICSVRPLRFCVDAARECDDTGLGTRVSSSGSGVSLAEGTGRPRTAAMIWGSVQLSETSCRPRQKGASLRSIWRKG